MIILCLLAIPLLTGIACLIPKKPLWQGWLQTAGMLLLLGFSWQVAEQVIQHGPIEAFNHLFYVDALSSLMLLLISLIAVFAAFYSMRYMLNEDEEPLDNLWKLKAYYGLLNLFILSMLGMVVLNNLGGFWIAIEGSTLFSAFLVGYYRKKESVEAAWKYIILCTVGIAFALIGIVLTYYAVVKAGGNLEQGLDWNYLTTLSPQLDPNLIKVAFVFILIGFGTKAGLAPIHNWLPDAHSEAPTPVSALLSGVLLKCAIYGIIRYGIIAHQVIGSDSINHFLLFFGLLSIGIAVPFILVQKNIKRLLAYSSMEHIGIIFVGLGLGTPLGVFGALFHMFNHALTKAVMFFAAGNLSMKYHSKNTSHIQGALQTMPISGGLLLLGGLALAGTPPFSIFLSEFYIVRGAVESGEWLTAILFVLFLVIVFGGLAHHLLQITMGSPPLPSLTSQTIPKGELNRSGLIAIILPFILIVLMAWWLPTSFMTLLNEAVKIITGGTLR